jgi:1-deoxy-D-xylulose-5-phosphate synthase
MDREVLGRVRQHVPVLVTVEENALPGGFGEGVLEALGEAGSSTDGVIRLGLPDAFVAHGTRQELLDLVGLTPVHLARAVLSRLGRETS